MTTVDHHFRLDEPITMTVTDTICTKFRGGRLVGLCRKSARGTITQIVGEVLDAAPADPHVTVVPININGVKLYCGGVASRAARSMPAFYAPFKVHKHAKR